MLLILTCTLRSLYESSSVVQIVTDNKANRLLNVENIYESQDISKQIELLRSEEFFKRVLNSLNLDVSYYNEGEVLTHEYYRNSPYEVIFNLIDANLYDMPIYIEFDDIESGKLFLQNDGNTQEVAFRVGDTIKTKQIELVIMDRDLKKMMEYRKEEQFKMFFIINSSFNNLKRLSSKYRVEMLSSPARTVKVTVTHNNKSLASTIADEIVNEFVAYDKEKLSEGAIQVLEFIDGQLNDVYGRLKESEVRLKEYKKDNRLSEGNQIARNYLEHMNELEEQKARLEVQRGILRDVKRNIDLEQTGVDINDLIPILAGSDFEEKLEQQIVQLQLMVTRRNNQLTSATNENPIIIVMDQQI